MRVAIVSDRPHSWRLVAWLMRAFGVAVAGPAAVGVLVALHGDRHLACAARVGRFVPRVGRLRA